MPPTVLLSPDYFRQPMLVVGHRGQQLSRLLAQNIPTPLSFCLTPNWLRTVADHNNLKLKIKKIIQNRKELTSDKQVSNQLRQVFNQISIPKTLVGELFELYHEYLKDDFVCVYPSHAQLEHLKHESIVGESNLIDSILQAWHQAVEFFISTSGSAKHLHEILFGSSILVEQQPKALISGQIYTKHPRTNLKHDTLVVSRWGEWNQGSKPKDRFVVDIRTNLVTERLVGRQQKTFKRELDRLVQEKTPDKQSSQSSLPDEAVIKLAEVAQKIKRQSLDHQIITWLADTKHRLVITDVKPMPDSELKTDNHRAPTITKVYISAGNPEKARDYCANPIDGVGLLRSEYTFAKLGTHPQHLLKGKYRPVLQKELERLIHLYLEACPGKPVVYRSCNFTSDQLRQLKHADPYEPEETNPYLGLRGGLALLSRPEFFKLELQVLRNVLDQKPQSRLGLMLPFVRSTSEAQALLDEVKKTNLMARDNFGVWLQLNTPNNIWELDTYPLKNLAGLSINLKSLHGLWLGIDPDNPEFRDRYSLSAQIGEEIISQVLTAIKQQTSQFVTPKPPQVLLHLEEYRAEFLTIAIRLGINGVIVKPKAATAAKNAIIDEEAKPLGVLR